MWRSDTNRREYLTRTLFHDISFLSPVQEEEESYDSPRRPATRSAVLSLARPYSPLPPLIIEVEKRVNKHDDPEEFYVKLEKKMKRIYRRLFIEGRNVASPMSTDEEDESSYGDNWSEERSNDNIDIDEDTDNMDNTEPVSCILDKTDRTALPSDRRLKRKTTSNNESIDSDEEEVKSKKSKSNDSTSADFLPRSSSKEEFDDETIASSIAEEDGYKADEENIEETNYAKVGIDSFIEEESIYESYNFQKVGIDCTSESLDHIQVTFQADVHRAYSDEGNEANYGLLLSADVADGTDDESDDDSGEDSANVSVQGPEAAGDEVVESLGNNEVPGNKASAAPDRGDGTTSPRIQPDDAHDAEPAGDEIEEPLEIDEVPYKLMAPAPEREVEQMRTPVIRPSVGSLPEHLADSSHDEQFIDLDVLNRTQDDNVNVDGDYADDDAMEEREAGTQTSCEDTGPEGWGNIFFGQPRVFKLCHCIYHVCD